MAVRIRLKRRGRKKLAMYDIVVADVRAPRDGKFIEKLGLYNPNTDPATIELNADRAFDWVMDGAQPSDTARTILSYKGVMIKKHLQVGVNKGAITQDEADKRYAEWMKVKEAKTQAKIDGLAKDLAATAKSNFEAETKIKEARAEALLKKQSEMIAAEEAAAKAKAAEEAPAEETEVATEEGAPVAEATETTPAEKAPVEEPKAEETAKPAEVKTEAPVEEKPAEEEKKEEAAEPAAAKEEPKAEEVKEEPKAEEVKEEAAEEVVAEPAAAEAKADKPAEAKEEEKKDKPTEAEDSEAKEGK